MVKINNENFHFNLDPAINKRKTKDTDKKSQKIKKGTILSFNELLDSQNSKPLPAVESNESEYEQELQTKLKEIGIIGERLKKSRQMIDLDRYKKLVQEYIKAVVTLSEKVDKRALWDRRRREKVEKVHLQIVNKELLELTEIFFSEQQNTLAIAAKIDRIEGMLIDLKS